MLPLEVSPWEARQVGLLAQRHGADANLFTIRKLMVGEGRYTVRVVARGAATVYDCNDAYDWMGAFAADLDAGVFGTAADDALPQEILEAAAEVESGLARRGLDGALKVLNARVPHRFTAVYKLEGPLLRNVASVDKHLHLDPLDLRTVPLKDSYCQFVLRDGLFLTRNSGEDPRLRGHPYCGVMNCYVGVPILRDGRMAGSLCHFDLADHDVPDSEYLLLQHAARLLPAFLDRRL